MVTAAMKLKDAYSLVTEVTSHTYTHISPKTKGACFYREKERVERGCSK